MKTTAMLNFSFSTLFLVFAVYLGLHFAKIETGNISDWAFGVVAFVWLMAVVTIPWNIYFEASNVIHEANVSKIQKIHIEETQLQYAHKMQKIGLVVAIVLHIVTAGFFYYLAMINVSFLGYWGAIFALTLTFFRPAQSVYFHISERLYAMRMQVTHPRKDILWLESRLNDIEENLKLINYQMDDNEQGSFKQNIYAEQDKNLQLLQKVQRELTDFKEQQQQKHIRLQHEQETALLKIAQENKNQIQNLAGEGKFVHDFLNNLTEIIRFIKKS